jgi:hypothetical protein
MILSSEFRRRLRRVVLFLLAGAVVLVGGGYIIVAKRLPEDAPLARMYRTEASLAGLVRAVEGYRHDTGAWPPPGPEGLKMATDHLSRAASYFPDGPPPDAWGRPFVYVPGDTYAAPGSSALRDARGGHFAPDSFQLYSVGADGNPGLEQGSAAEDNIVSWDDSRPWRALYHKMNKAFMLERR